MEKIFEVKCEKMTFSDYFNSLPEEDKIALRDILVPRYFAYSTFYRKVQNENWNTLEREKIEQVTKLSFLW